MIPSELASERAIKLVSTERVSERVIEERLFQCFPLNIIFGFLAVCGYMCYKCSYMSHELHNLLHAVCSYMRNSMFQLSSAKFSPAQHSFPFLLGSQINK